MEAKRAEGRVPVVELALAVQPYDLDPVGIVGPIAYTRWLEALRARLLRPLLETERRARELAPVLIASQIDYREPIGRADRPVGRMWLTQAEDATWTVRAEIRLGAKVAAQATQRGVLVAPDTLRPVELPEGLRGALLRAGAR